MKILAVGDLHGKIPVKLKKEAGKVDLILCTGDFANANRIRKIIFKTWGDKKWFEMVGLKKAREYEKESFDSGLDILKQINKLAKKMFFIWGNTDFYKEHTTSEPPVIMPGYYNEKIKELKNLVLIDKKKRRINNFDVIGYGGYVDATEFIKNPIDKDKKKQEKRLKRYEKDKDDLKKLFSKKKPKNFIFIIHCPPPYGYFDNVKLRSSPMYGKNVGWEPYNDIIKKTLSSPHLKRCGLFGFSGCSEKSESCIATFCNLKVAVYFSDIKKYKPLLVVCGHIHENQGKKRLGRSWIINTGAACDGKAAIIETDDKKKKIKNIRFLR